jgi:tRNA pseudouridine38-40 synthase
MSATPLTSAIEPASPDRDGGLVRVRLDLGYDGTDFVGWARQPGLRTVQGVLEGAMQVTLRLDDPPSLTVAGRTDSGVHARGQVAHLDVAVDAWTAGAGSALRRLNGLLPKDVRVTSIVTAPPAFDARFGALWRRYTYRVSDAVGGPDPLRRHEVVAYPRPLDVATLNEASAPLVGTHEFAAFCRRRAGATTVRTLLDLSWVRTPDGTVEANVCADAFCHSMVRSLMGALLPVGAGVRPAAWAAQVLAGGVREPTVQVAPPHGLTLEEVAYPQAEDLAAQAYATRRRRA